MVKSSFNESYKYYESRGDTDKKLSAEQCLNMIKPYLSDLINEDKTIKTSSNEWKIQRNMHINFVSSNDTGDIRTVFVRSDNEDSRLFHNAIKSHPEGTQGNHHLFSCDYNSGIDFPAGTKEWKTLMKQLLLIFCKYHMMK